MGTCFSKSDSDLQQSLVAGNNDHEVARPANKKLVDKLGRGMQSAIKIAAGFVPIFGTGLQQSLQKLENNREDFLRAGKQAEFLFSMVNEDMNLMHKMGVPKEGLGKDIFEMFQERVHNVADGVEGLVNKYQTTTGHLGAVFAGPDFKDEVDTIYMQYTHAGMQLRNHASLLSVCGHKQLERAGGSTAPTSGIITTDSTVFGNALNEVEADDVDPAVLENASNQLQTGQDVAELAKKVQECVTKDKEQQKEMGFVEMSDLTFKYQAEWAAWQDRGALTWRAQRVNTECEAYRNDWVDADGMLTEKGAEQALREREHGVSAFGFSTPTKANSGLQVGMQKTPNGCGVVGTISIAGGDRKVFQTRRHALYYYTPNGNKTYITKNKDRLDEVVWDKGTPPTVTKLDFSAVAPATPPAPGGGDAVAGTIELRGRGNVQVFKTENGSYFYLSPKGDRKEYITNRPAMMKRVLFSS